jgi:hypothetical protein
MHRIVGSYHSTYRNASRSEKKIIGRVVIQEIRDEGGRFLKRPEDGRGVEGDEWVEAADDAVYEKISHALRGNSGNRRDSVEAQAAIPAAIAPRRRKDRNVQPAAATVPPAPVSSPSSDAHGTTALSNDLLLLPGSHSSNTQANQLSSNLLPGLISSVTATAANPLASSRNLLAAQALQNQFFLQPQAVGFASPALDLLLRGASQAPTGDLTTTLVGFSQPRLNQQLVNLLLSPANPSNPPPGAGLDPGTLSQLILQQRQQQQQQQQQAQLLHELEAELAWRRLVPAMSAVPMNSPSWSVNRNIDLVLSALLGNSATGPPHSLPIL